MAVLKSGSMDKVRAIALMWLLALGLSAVLVAAGRRWLEPLSPQAGWIWALLLLLPLGTLALLLARWPVDDERESSLAKQERR